MLIDRDSDTAEDRWLHVFDPLNEPSPYERHVFRTALGEAAPAQVTEVPGEARPYSSPDGRHVAFLNGSDTQPTGLYLVEAITGARPRRITDSHHDQHIPKSFATARDATFPSLHDDATLHARILEPPSLEPGRRYPVRFGPVYSDTVRNRWGGFYALL